MKFAPRLLPVTVLVAAVVLAFHVGNFLQAAKAMSDPAQEPGAGASSVARLAQASNATASDPASAPARPGTDGSSASDGGTIEPPARAGDVASGIRMPKDPSAYSDTELDVLQQLAKRRKELDEREKNMDLREGVLKAAEKRVGEKIDELKKLQKVVAGLLKQYQEAQDEKIKSLVTIYEKMKAPDAARILSKLDLPVLLEVVTRMKASKVAPILAAMDPDKAKQVTAELATRRDDDTLLKVPGS